MTEHEQEGKVTKNKKSLLMKYEIPIDRLSFKYVEKCNDRKELERIVKILRSGEEGFYPQLTKCAESRLEQIAPESRLLWTKNPLLTKSTMGSKNWNEIAEEMANWTQEMKNRDQDLQDCCVAPGPDLPAVRHAKNRLASTEAGPSRAKLVAPRDYSEWDKFDADKEILKMELEEERKREQTAKNKKQQEKEKKKNKNEVENSALKAAGNLSPVEREYMATQEKNRGNDYYHSGDYEQAVECYSNSIVLCPTPAAYNNRAMAQLKLQKYGEVIADCNQVLKIEPNNVKALHRRGVAHQGKNCYEQAYEDFSKVMELEPENQAAKSLAEQIKRKLEPAVKSIRLSIEDQCYQPHGFVFPSPKPNIAVNEWGLAKVMCRCNGTPSWVHKKPSKCKVCQKKRAERRMKREEEAVKLAEMSEVKVGTSVGENPEIDQMLTDEKGSGDMRATEKIVELDSGFESTMQTTLEDIKMNDKIESMPTKDEKDIAYTCNVVRKENSKSERYTDNLRNNEIAINSKVTSTETETSNSKTELNLDSKVLTNEDLRKSPKEIKQKSSEGNDNHSGKQMKVKVANKYKKNANTERETTPEQQDCDVSSTDTITSPFEFVKVWESLKVTSDLLSHAQVLRSVKPSDLASVIGNKLDGPMLSTILMCLEKNFAPELVLEYLNNIVQLPRFGIIVMFLQAAEKQAVCSLLEKLEDSDVHTTAAIRQAFNC